MFNALSFAELSHPRQRLLRACQAVNYGHIANLLVRDREPLFGPETTAFADLSSGVRHHVRGFIDHLLNNRLEIFSSHAFHMHRLNAAAALQHRNDCGFIRDGA